MAMGVPEQALTLARTCAMAASVRSERRPRSPGVILPSGETAVASAISSPAPEIAIWSGWIRCQSPASPFSAEYWHIGATTMRLARVRLSRLE